MFDTADTYGDAEKILGRAIAAIRRDVWLATKVGAGNEGRPDCSPQHVIASCERSLRRLQTDLIDLYQIHFPDPATPVADTVGALERLRRDGKIRHYGVGHLPADTVMSYIREGTVFSAMTELSAVARGARDRILPLCRRHAVAVLAFSVTGRGLLSGKFQRGHVFEPDDIRSLDALFQRARFDSGLRVCDALATVGERLGKTPIQVAIAWVLAQPGVVCALTGPSSLEHLEENLGGAGWELPADELSALEGLLRAEDARTRDASLIELREILNQELVADKAFTDLVYLFETLAELKLAREEEFLPLFLGLFALRESQDLEKMRSIQVSAREAFGSRIFD